MHTVFSYFALSFILCLLYCIFSVNSFFMSLFAGWLAEKKPEPFILINHTALAAFLTYFLCIEKKQIHYRKISSIFSSATKLVLLWEIGLIKSTTLDFTSRGKSGTTYFFVDTERERVNSSSIQFSSSTVRQYLTQLLASLTTTTIFCVLIQIVRFSVSTSRVVVGSSGEGKKLSAKLHS